MKLTITPAKLHGTVTPPPSKSQAHRYLIAAALAAGESVIENVALSDDIRATLRCMEALGAAWTLEGNALRVRGAGGSTPLASTGEELPRLDCGESGSTLRFLIPVALALAGGGIFTGRGRLMERPQQPYFDLFREKGVFYEQSGGVLTLRGRLAAGEYRLPGNVSSQFFTGLLFALPLLAEPSVIIPATPLESAGYIAMTLRAMAEFGVTVPQTRSLPPHFPVPGGGRYVSRRAAVEADWSQAAFWYAAQVLGSSVTVAGMNEQSLQGDREVLPYSRMIAAGGQVELDVSGCPDLAPPLAAMGALMDGELRLTNAGRLRIKESDRLAAVTAALNAMGARVAEHPDSLTIYGRDALAGGCTVDCRNDHRIAMMAAVAATRCREPVTLLGAECVSKSYPGFWEDYQTLGGIIHEHPGK